MTELNKILKLSVPERILLVEAIWDSIASEPAKVELSSKHKKLLDERLEKYHTDPLSGSTWEEVKKRVKKK